MPSGHASHKGSSPKPNTNANDRIDTAADLGVDPQEILGEEGNATRIDEAAENATATERPSHQSPETNKSL